MNRLIKALSLLFLNMLIGFNVYAIPNFQTIDPYVVCIETALDHNRKRVGSGFFISPTVIATVFHQVKDQQNITVFYSDGNKTEARLIGAHVQHDVALLQVRTPANHPLILGQLQDIHLGDEVFTIGCPLGYEHTLSKGFISHKNRQVNDETLIQIDLTVNQGNSGGPLLNSQGKVIGMIYGFLKDSERINFAISADKINDLWQQVQSKLNPLSYEIKQLWQKAVQSKDPITQIEYYHQIILKRPDFAKAYFNQGLAFYRIGQYERAQASFKQATEKQSGYYQAYTNLGLTLFKLGRYNEAKVALIKAISIEPKYVFAYSNLAIVYERGLGDVASAKKTYIRLLQLDLTTQQQQEIRHRLKRYSNIQ